MLELLHLYLQLTWQHDSAAGVLVVTGQLMKTAGAESEAAIERPGLHAQSAL